jgi:hypothetical protein
MHPATVHRLGYWPGSFLCSPLLNLWTSRSGHGCFCRWLRPLIALVEGVVLQRWH